MAIINVNRVFELSKALQTKAGQELKDPLGYLSDLAENVIRILKSGITFKDNLDCEIKNIVVRENTEQIITPNSRKRPAKILVDRVIDATYYSYNSFGWKFNSNGEVVVRFKFDGPPPATRDIPVVVTLIYG